MSDSATPPDPIGQDIFTPYLTGFKGVYKNISSTSQNDPYTLCYTCQL